MWVITGDGKSMPLDPEPVEDGNVEMTGGERRSRQGSMLPEVRVVGGQQSLAGVVSPLRYVSHFATCPNADDHRRR